VGRPINGKKEKVEKIAHLIPGAAKGKKKKKTSQSLGVRTKSRKCVSEKKKGQERRVSKDGDQTKETRKWEFNSPYVKRLKKQTM